MLKIVKGVAFKSLGEYNCEIKGGGKETTTMMLMPISSNNAPLDIITTDL